MKKKTKSTFIEGQTLKWFDFRNGYQEDGFGFMFFWKDVNNLTNLTMFIGSWHIVVGPHYLSPFCIKPPKPN